MKLLSKSVFLLPIIALGLTGCLNSRSKGMKMMFLEHKVVTNNQGLQVGDDAPKFIAVSKDLKEVTVGGAKDKVQIIAFFPSIDTGICALETAYFNKSVSKMNNVEISVISKDTPFAFSRFCKANDIKNINTLSDYKDASNVKKYGAIIASPKFLEEFFARIVYIVNTKGKIAYKQVVKDIKKEPDYKDILLALKDIG